MIRLQQIGSCMLFLESLFDLFERPSLNTSSTSFGECTKPIKCENTQEKERNPSNNEVALDEGEDYISFIILGAFIKNFHDFPF